MQPRRIARELALLSLSQLPNSPEKLESQQLSNLVLAAIRILTTEAQDALSTAAAELQRALDRLLTSETRAGDLQTGRIMVREAIDLTQTAINRVATGLDLPELIHLTNHPDFDVRAYALQIVSTVNAKRAEIDEQLEKALVDWQVARLARIDRDLLRIALAEIMFLGVPERVVINEAVELAKRYSGDEGHRFINGVLRRVSEQIKAAAYPS
jgi:N utilization substance protein B